ncbi:hypothetical protein QW71_26545 [Paenibacillus sp. IHB B 3415]|uniref:helix-turn-helix domain-containing protein n=1 Tax=Paenibacillus sp. IHB B 3415 TaxID=867080 RepID=UPI000575CD82|nr:helix-turn-helix domain-containing protein [Paenibacillus sp. IHB B 3415]KHL92884.1 hypothetical protein QW71_26545 [Paenibacillus sp. IHB B 3415]
MILSSTKLIFNEDEVQRLQTRIGQVSQDTNRLYLQLKGQSSGWDGIPLGDRLVKAQVLINELTVEAEKLEDIIRVALKGVTGLQEENKRQADKLTQQFSLLAGAFGSFGTSNTAGRVSIPAFVQRSVSHLITSYEIAKKSGFENTKNFNRVFKESEGVSPVEYRNQQKVLSASIDQ